MIAPLHQRLIDQLKGQGYDADAAHDIALAGLQKAGNLDHNGELTAKGYKRQAMGSDGRARDRAAKASNGLHHPYEYQYDPKTNRATLFKP